MMNSIKTKRIYIACLIIVALMTAVGIFICNSQGIDVLRPEYIRDVSVDIIGMLVCEILLVGLFASDNKDVRNRAMFRINFSLATLFFLVIIYRRQS